MFSQMMFVYAFCGFPGLKKGSKNVEETDWSDFHLVSTYLRKMFAVRLSVPPAIPALGYSRPRQFPPSSEDHPYLQCCHDVASSLSKSTLLGFLPFLFPIYKHLVGGQV